MDDVCPKHSGMEQKIKTNAEDIAKIEITNTDQYKRLDKYALFSNDWEKINNHGEEIASMKTHLRIVMVLLVFVLGVVSKIAFGF